MNAPGDHARLNPPATPLEIAAIAENRFALHADLRTWLSLHNGVRAGRAFVGPGGFLPGGYFLLDTEGMRLGQRDMESAIAWSLEDDNVDFVVGGVAHVRWIPLAGTHVGTQLVVDHREGPDFGAVLEIDADAELWGVKRWSGLAGMFAATHHALSTGTPVRDGVGQDVYPQVIEDADGARHVDWR
ncbi:SMI1/KNR4 family protein [Streptomyces sp. NBC_01233]|uniref:SMI1/KNR4 family protein n=1 Tax=Streptomyces sp. NBC_01233 TaxID=2903787 RepID=UPI002E13DFA7|nr:SMI1/KNR4 family protein [Streptomyces sp. NBC_01233]